MRSQPEHGRAPAPPTLHKRSGLQCLLDDPFIPASVKGSVPLLTVAVLAAAPLARAEGPRLDYTQGPASCLDESQFRREVAIRGDGADLFSKVAPDLLRVWFEQLRPDAYRGSYEYVDGAGRRDAPTVIVYENCETLGRWVGISARDYLAKQPPSSPASASAVAPAAVAPAAAAPAAVAPAAAAPAVPPVTQPAPPAKSSQRVAPPLTKQDDVDFLVEPVAAVVASVGVTDSVQPGFSVGVNFRRNWFSLGLAFRGLPPGEALVKDKIPDAPHYGEPFPQQVSQWAAVFSPCAHLATYFVGCAAIQAGGLVIKAPFAKDIKTGAIFTIGPRVGIEIPFSGRFAVAVYAEVPVNIVRKELNDRGPSLPFTNRRWTAPPAYGIAGVSFGVSFQ
jgi:hypothetical protein